jgi:HEAT repeat protein
MTIKTKGLILGGSAIALGVLGVAMRSCVSDAMPGGEARLARVPAATWSSERTAPGRQWSAGTTYVYEIASTRTITLHGDNGAGQSTTLGLAGRLSISVVGPRDDGILLRLAVDATRPDGGAALATLAGATRLSAAFYAVAEPTGELASLSFPRGLGGADRAMLKALASTLQLVVPDPAAAAWRTTEQDASGEYEAAYSATGAAIHKTKERFVRARGAHGLAPIEDPSTYRVVSSNDFELDASGWPRTVSEDETLTVTASAMEIAASSATRAHLAAIEQAPDLLRIAAAEQASLAPEPEVDREGFASAKRRADEGLVDGAGYPALLADLASSDVKLRNRTMARLAALFRIQPDEAARAAASIVRGELGGDATKRLIGALGGAGTGEAQHALSAVLAADPLPPETRSDAAAALGMTRAPTDDAARALARAARTADAAVASSATLGLGNLVKRMTEASGDPSELLAMLIERLQGAADDAERVLCLDALGNTGDARALPAIAPYLDHGDAGVRAAAVAALRFLAGVDDRLVAALQDGAPVVRRAAAGALAYRAITPLLPLVTLVLQHDVDVETRLAVVMALVLRKRQEPRLADLLAWAAEHDPAAEVRSAARRALGS